MNSVPNSDSKQCPESKLGWVHQVNTLAQLARTGRAHCAQAVSWACARPYRGLKPAVSQAWLVVSRIVSRHKAVLQPLYRRPLSRYKLCIATQTPAARHSAHLPCVSQRSLAMSQGAGRRIAALAALYCDTRPPLRHYTKFCIATLSLARPCARALPHAPRASRPYRRPLSRPYRRPPGRAVAVSWPSPLRLDQTPQPCVTIQSIVS